MMRVPVGLFAACVLAISVTSARAHDLRGAWRADSYVLKSGEVHDVEGLMIFSESEWSVVYFVKDADGQPQRGAGEGGPYTLEGDELVLTRDYLVIAGHELGELREIPLRFDIPAVKEPVIEVCRVELEEDRIIIEFPSGNEMGFRRSSGP